MFGPDIGSRSRQFFSLGSKNACEDLFCTVPFEDKAEIEGKYWQLCQTLLIFLSFLCLGFPAPVFINYRDQSLQLLKQFPPFYM
jgi:hypothetical protein